MTRFWNAALLCAALTVPIAFAPTALLADDQKAERNYQDKQNKDEHQWNKQEDKAYRKYLKESHHRYNEFSTLKEDDQQAYWNWRHQHSDAVLKIEIK